MANRRLSMRKTKEILRLKYEFGLSNRKIARSCSILHGMESTLKSKVKSDPNFFYWKLLNGRGSKESRIA